MYSLPFIISVATKEKLSGLNHSLLTRDSDQSFVWSQDKACFYGRIDESWINSCEIEVTIIGYKMIKEKNQLKW